MSKVPFFPFFRLPFIRITFALGDFSCSVTYIVLILATAVSMSRVSHKFCYHLSGLHRTSSCYLPKIRQLLLGTIIALDIVVRPLAFDEHPCDTRIDRLVLRDVYAGEDPDCTFARRGR